MTIEALQVIGPLLTGPVAALTLACGGLYAGYMLVVKHIIPSHRDNIKELIQSHKEDREEFSDAIKVFNLRFDRLEDDVSEIKMVVKAIERR